MALTALQRTICRLLAENRIATDLFHDAERAVVASWDADRRLLQQHGYQVHVLRERPSFIEAEVRTPEGSVRMEWARDSAYRFFPLMRHDELGLTLHPFDLATNKVLALVGRLEVRDWLDAILCAERVQPLGYLAWAACGKDPGFSPEAILVAASRSSHYSADEVAELAFDGAPPDAGALSRRWHALLAAARETIRVLPAEEVGKCVLTPDGQLFEGDQEQATQAVSDGSLRFHAGCLRGAFPQFVSE